VAKGVCKYEKEFLEAFWKIDSHPGKLQKLLG
jgi:hypothetical protein